MTNPRLGVFHRLIRNEESFQQPDFFEKSYALLPAPGIAFEGNAWNKPDDAQRGILGNSRYGGGGSSKSSPAASRDGIVASAGTQQMPNWGKVGKPVLGVFGPNLKTEMLGQGYKTQNWGRFRKTEALGKHKHQLSCARRLQYDYARTEGIVPIWKESKKGRTPNVGGDLGNS